MSLKKQRMGQIGVNVVERVVIRDWRCRWQPIDSHNDDGVDGLIFLEQNGEATGQVVYVQVKCFSNVRLDAEGRYCLPIGIERLNDAIRRWKKLVGAAIVVYVDPRSERSFWVDARSLTCGISQVFVPALQKFDKEARKIISAMCGNIHRDLLTRTIITEASDFPHLRARDHIQVASHNLYRELSSKPVRIAKEGPIVSFNQSGWQHITRRRRPDLTRYQSFVLLGTVRKLLESTPEEELTDHFSRSDPTTPYVAARATISFPFRQSGIVKLILRWAPTAAGRSYSFHTIYEPRRKRNLLGAREPLSQ